MTSSAAPRVRLSRSALADNARDLLREGGIVDLRFDGLGHGAAEVAPVVLQAGASAVLVDDETLAARLTAEGIPATTTAVATIDPYRLFGIPHASTGTVGRPVMSLQGRVLSTKPLYAGEAVSYGYTHRAAADTRVALVTGGYAQGLPRALGNHVRVQVAENLRPVVGRIAMDVCVVDLEGTDAGIGGAVTFFGGQGAVRDALRDWAEVTGLTPLEVAAVIGQNGSREWVA